MSGYGTGRVAWLGWSGSWRGPGLRDQLGRHALKLIGVGRELRGPVFGGMRGVMRVVALAAGLVLAVTVMPGCGSGCPTPEQKAYLNEVGDWAENSKVGIEDMRTILKEVESRPEALIDEDWRHRLKRVLDDMNSKHETMINVKAAPGTGEVRDAADRVAEAAIQTNELLWEGVVDVDAEVLRRALESQSEATHLVEELVRVVDRFCE